jgi:hypothetical protein
MNVPLAQFFLEAVFQADLSPYFRLMLILLMIGIQVFAVLGFNIILISDFSGGETSYMELLAGVPTAATSNYEVYRYEYRYWIVLEVFYEMINSLWTNVGARGYPDVYWLNFICHILYTYLHAVLRPSLFRVHNMVEVSAGICQIFEDIAVLESMYGGGSLATSGVWSLVCGVIPAGVGAIDWVAEQFCQDLDGWDDVDASLEERCEIENWMFRTVFIFLLVGSGGGVIFMHLISVVGYEVPPGGWWGLYVVVPLCTVALFALLPIVILCKGGDICDCLESACEFCAKAFCWCTGRTQIYPAWPDY